MPLLTSKALCCRMDHRLKSTCYPSPSGTRFRLADRTVGVPACGSQSQIREKQEEQSEGGNSQVRGLRAGIMIAYKAMVGT